MEFKISRCSILLSLENEIKPNCHARLEFTTSLLHCQSETCGCKWPLTCCFSFFWGGWFHPYFVFLHQLFWRTHQEMVSPLTLQTSIIWRWKIQGSLPPFCITAVGVLEGSSLGLHDRLYILGVYSSSSSSSSSWPPNKYVSSIWIISFVCLFMGVFLFTKPSIENPTFAVRSSPRRRQGF